MVIPDESTMAKVLVKTHYIVKVLAFYPETQTVDVIQETFEYVQNPAGTIVKKNEFGYEVNMMLAAPSVIYGVPVQQMRWGQFSIQCAPQPGDTGYIEVMTDDSRSWVKDGGPAMPWLATKMNKESCVFVPFVANEKNAIKDYVSDANTLTIKSKNGSIVFKDSEDGSSVEITVNKTIINSEESTMSGNLTVEGNITTNGEITADGNISTSKEINAEGNVTVGGELSAEGAISSKQDITSDSDIVAGGISLKNHTHRFSYEDTQPNGTPIPKTGTTEKA